MKQQLTGKVVSDKMVKTIVVSVERLKSHPKYKSAIKQTNITRFTMKANNARLGIRL